VESTAAASSNPTLSARRLLKEFLVKSLEFEATLDSEANLKVPDDLAAQIQTGQPVRVILACRRTPKRRIGAA